LLFTSNSSIDYGSIVGKNIEETVCSNNPHKYQKLLSLISFVNTIVAVDTSDLAVQCLVNKVNKDRLFRFYGQFVNTFKEWKAIEIKKRVLTVVFNKEFF
jgi:hypothetical protein